ncbi:ABC transporter permease [Citricoccus sp. GCM10030269]|uniref:ABC transporter permease n=1 Tax=Citricoccus sp. GCM10030269 TaxID=3273388 RepID=UPI00360D6BAC
MSLQTATTRGGPAHRDSAGHQNNSAFAGTGRLIRSMLRADRLRLPIWLAAIVGFIAYVAVVVPAVLGDVAIGERGAIMAEPAAAMMAGPGYGIERYTLEVMMANEMLGMFAVAVAIMSLGLIVRHTRNEEETGRAELVRAAPVGRHAQLTAAVVVLVVANLLLGAGTAVALMGAGAEPILDCWAFGAALTGVGLAFGGIAATTAQLTSRARTASGMAGAVLGATYVLRAVGDAQERGGSVLSWLSPIGWAQQMRIFVDLRWEPLLLLAAVAVVGLALGFALSARRDVGAGLLPEKRGRAAATSFGRTLLGLTWRMERGRLIWWSVALLIFALLTGSLAGPLADMIQENPQMLAALGADAADSDAVGNLVVATMGLFLKFFAMAVAVYAAMSTRQLRSDESNHRTEIVLSSAASRYRWLGIPMLVTAAASVLLLAVSGLGLGLSASAEAGPEAVGEFVLAALAYVPLILCWVAAAMLLYGLGWNSGLLWALLGASFVVGMYGTMVGLPDEIVDAEPFSMIEPIALVRGDDADWAPLIGATVVAVILAAGALVSFRRRDLMMA